MDYYNLAEKQSREEKIPEALVSYDRAIEMDPQFFSAHLARGRTHFCLGNMELALADSINALKLKPGSIEALKLKAGALDNSGRYREALKIYNQLIALNPDNPLLFNERAGVNLNLKRPRSAVMDYSQAIKLRPDYGEAYMNRGIIYTYVEFYPRAIDDFTVIIERNLPTGDSPLSYVLYNRAVAYLRMDNKTLARRDFEWVINRYPQCNEADMAQEWLNKIDSREIGQNTDR